LDTDGHKQKYGLGRWNIICRPKDQGGLGIEVLDIKNQCLLRRWLFKLLNEEGVWQEFLQNKYLHSKSLIEVSVKPNFSPFWKGLMKAKDDFFTRGSITVGNGEGTWPWEGTWLGNKSLGHKYPSMYSKQVSVANVLSRNPLNISLRRTFSNQRWRIWL
jgi:hypothetical protein